MTTLACRYIDHFSCDKKDLGIFYQDIPSFEGEYNILTTCHRIEVINVIENDVLFNFDVRGYKSKQILGNKEICLRLAKIAAGVESVILGERFVFNQVMNAFKEQDTHPLIFQIVKDSLDIAKRARNKFDFYSHADYSDIAIQFLEDTSNIVIIGSGMLAKAISHKLDRNTIIVTRSLKSAHKKFKNIDICKIRDLPKIPFRCIIATTSNLKYRKDVRKFLNESDCFLVIDLSAVPFLDNPKFRHITMYDEVFEQKIKNTNKKLISKLPLMLNTIREQVNELGYE